MLSAASSTVKISGESRDVTGHHGMSVGFGIEKCTRLYSGSGDILPTHRISQPMRLRNRLPAMTDIFIHFKFSFETCDLGYGILADARYNIIRRNRLLGLRGVITGFILLLGKLRF